ncbi:MAG: hypothetical protein JXR59_04025 [Desulfuromonadaceae bacterium]|nr:hypothetical protein [Desulfuromonadaceae bacterium]
MGRAQRNKGATAERELAKLLSDQLGAEVSRNLLQTREGGHDLNGVGGWAVEVKRHETLNLTAWWEQTLRQAQRSGQKPVLAYRQSRRPWSFVVRLCDLCPSLTGDCTAQLNLDGFCLLVREQLTWQCFTCSADPDQLQQIRGLCTRLGVTTNIPAADQAQPNF